MTPMTMTTMTMGFCIYKGFRWRFIQNEKKRLPCVETSLLSGWGTRIRTRKGRTRICSVTITPYPKTLSAIDLLSNAGAKVVTFPQKTKFFLSFFSWQNIFMPI